MTFSCLCPRVCVRARSVALLYIMSCRCRPSSSNQVMNPFHAFLSTTTRMKAVISIFRSPKVRFFCTLWFLLYSTLVEREDSRCRVNRSSPRTSTKDDGLGMITNDLYCEPGLSSQHSCSVGNKMRPALVAS